MLQDTIFSQSLQHQLFYYFVVTILFVIFLAVYIGKYRTFSLRAIMITIGVLGLTFVGLKFFFDYAKITSL